MATGTRLMQEINDQFLSCKLCDGKFREPKTLTCLHTFCLPCLQSHYDTEAEARAGRYSIYLRHVRCPVCQKKTDLPSGGVRRLPDNFLVSNLTDVLAKQVTSQETPCEICLTVKNKPTVAKCKCLDCCKLLCEACLTLHRQTKVTSHHSLVDLHEEKNIQCKVHEEEYVRYYCSQCEACICVLCAFQEHRDHDVCAFSEVTDGHREHLSGMLDQCQGRLQEVTDRLSTLNRQEKAVTEARERIKDMAIAYISQVRCKERELIQEIDSLCGGDLGRLKEEKNSLQEYKANLDSCCRLTDVMLKEQGVDILLVKKEIQTKMNSLLEPLQPSPRVEVDLSDLTFVPGTVSLGQLNLGGPNDANDANDANRHVGAMTNGLDSDSGLDTAPSSVTVNSPDVLRRRNKPQNMSGMMLDVAERLTNSNVQSNGITTSASARMDQASNSPRNATAANAPERSVRTDPMPAPDLLPPSPYLNGGRKIFSRRSQTNVSVPDTGCDVISLTDTELTTLLGKAVNAQVDGIQDIDQNSRRNRRARRRAGDKEISYEQNQRSLVEVGTMTMTEVKVVIERKDQQTSPDVTLTGPFRWKEERNLEDKCTETVAVPTSDQETFTVDVQTENRGVITDQVSTCDRASDGIRPHTQHRAVGTVQVRRNDFAAQSCPSVTVCATNTPKTLLTDQECQATDLISAIPTTLNSGPLDDRAKTNMNTVPAFTRSLSPSSFVTKDMGSDPIIMPRPCKATGTIRIRTATAATETAGVKKVHQDTCTYPTKSVDQWTETETPQMVNTGISPPRPATLDTGVGTTPVSTAEEATGTEVKTFRDIHTEMIHIVCDNETLTEGPHLVDAQTSMNIVTNTAACGTDSVDNTDEGLNTTESTPSKSPSPQPGEPCTKCGHDPAETPAPATSLNDQDTPQTAEMINVAKPDDDSMRRPSQTQDVGTMAISCSSERPALQVQDLAVQTLKTQQRDVGSITCEDWDQDFCWRPLADHQDVATSTESLPYIGLLSEMDIDELIVVPEAVFDLVSDSGSDYDVMMVDTQTSTDYVQCVEEGTQTREFDSAVPASQQVILLGDSTTSGKICSSSSSPEDRKCVGGIIKSLVESHHSDVCVDEHEKHQVSIGINTDNAMTFEKETCTPMRHLFSKGTMTFYVSKLDKSTSTLGQPSSLKPGSSMVKSRSVDKITMTSKTDKKDVAVETDNTCLDGRITACISKLRNVSERLKSPTERKSSDNIFFPVPSNQSAKMDLLSPDCPSNTHEICRDSERRQQVQNLLEEIDGKMKQKDSPSVRKPQPITTLKGRRPSCPNPNIENPKAGSLDNSNEGTQSLPRKLKSERTGGVRMGSQPLTPSRLPLLRYNSAPGRIATVPTQTLLNKAAETLEKARSRSPRLSPSKIPITKKKSPPDYSPLPTPRQEDTKTEEKPILRRPLPSITETRTSSSCSDASTSSFLAALPTPRPSSGAVDVPDNNTNTELLSPAATKATKPGTELLIVVPADSSGTPSPARSPNINSRPASSLSNTTSTSSLDERIKDKNSKTATPRGSTDTINSTKGEEKTPTKKGGLGFVQRLLSKTKKTPDKKKEKSAPSIPLPTVQPAVAAAALATATLPPSPSVSREQQQHWPKLQLPPHHYPPLPGPKSPSPPRKPRPFVIVNQRVVPIQQNNVEIATERRNSKDHTGAAAILKQLAGSSREDGTNKDESGSKSGHCVSTGAVEELVGKKSDAKKSRLTVDKGKAKKDQSPCEREKAKKKDAKTKSKSKSKEKEKDESKSGKKGQ